MFLENKIGSLEVGKKADIAIWDRDLYAVAYSLPSCSHPVK